jgi:AGCS family alanine or glycine:cation symporter
MRKRQMRWIIGAALAGILAAVLAVSSRAGAEAANPAAASRGDSSAAEASSTSTFEDAVQSAIEHTDEAFNRILVEPLEKVIYFDFGTGARWGEKSKLNFVVIWLIIGAAFFTVRMGFINFRAFWHSIRLTKGDYHDATKFGEVSHFQALASALAATLGLGNIAGVATAVAVGGPGAVFWMIVAGLIGMSSKFCECTLGVMYRKISPDGRVSGGPMHYLRDGLAELGWGKLGTVLAAFFAVMCIGGALGGGCAYQVNQSVEAIVEEWPQLAAYKWVYGLLLMFAVGVVIIGGIQRIAAAAERIVPAMCALYVLACLYVLGAHFRHIPWAAQAIWDGAFSAPAAYGGFIGVLMQGFKRASFSNEAGIGSASIAHSAAQTDEPVSEGIVALLEPFIDTVVVCTMTGLVIVITEAYHDPAYAALVADRKGAALTSAAFGGVVSWFSPVIVLCIFLFAYATLIAWSYYGERCWSHLFGERASLAYKLLYLVFIMLGAVVQAKHILDFSDMMILAMAFPNVVGLVMLSGKIKRSLDDYWRRYKAGELEPAARQAAKP